MATAVLSPPSDKEGGSGLYEKLQVRQDFILAFECIIELS